MSQSSQSLSGRSNAQAHRKARMSGKSASSVAPVVAQPIVQRAVSQPVSVSTPQPASRRAVAPSGPILAEGRESAKAKRKQSMKGRSNTAAAARPNRAQKKTPTNNVIVQAEVIKTSREVSTAKFEPLSKTATRQTVSASGSVSTEGRESAKARRKQSMHGKTGLVKRSVSKPTRAKKNKPEAVIIESRPKTEIKVSRRDVDENNRTQLKGKPIVDSSGRNMSKAWRKALLKGKTGEAVYKSKNGLIGSVAKIANPDASTRDIARSVREQRCTKGKTCVPTSSATSKRQERKKSSAGVEKVAFSSTLSGQGVSGTQVGQGQATGIETGACKLVSGTEYLSMEEFSTHCSTAPNAAPAKVTTTQTTKGQIVSGNKMGQAQAVTGDRSGQCSAITGTEYLPADQSEIFCGITKNSSKATQATDSFSLKTIAPQAGTQTSKQATTQNSGGIKISGGNAFPDQSGSIMSSSIVGYEIPKKVLLSNTFAGNPTTGTQVGSPRVVTGDDKGKCLNLTGTGYQGKEEVEQVCQTSAPSGQPEKVNISGTFSGQTITGDRSGSSSSNVTGGEAGRCKPVSGSIYMGSETFVSNCTPEEKQALLKKFEPMVRQHGHPLTGIQPGPQGLTGAQKGACELVSGTNYQGSDQVNMLCGSSQAAVPGESDFPVMISGVAPVGMMQAAPMAVAEAMPPVTNAQPESPASNITGDGWDRGTKVTGTEGPWATQRNPSRQGSSVQTPMSAAAFRPNAMLEVPQSPITGSSGNTDTGAKVTLSGGARA